MTELSPRTDRNRKPAILFVSCLSYLLSFGPACWLLTMNHSLATTYRYVYSPLIWTGSYGPEPVRNSIRRYANWGVRKGTVIVEDNRLWYFNLAVFT